MKYFYIILLLIISLYSCVTRKEHDKVLKENRDIKNIIERNDLLTQELKELNFKIKNIEFSLQMYEIRLRRQEKKLVECINTRGCKWLSLVKN